MDDKSTIEDLRTRLAAAYLKIHFLECEGAFSLDRDPFALMPAIDAYCAVLISDGKMRECIRRWLAGESFRDATSRDWEP